MFVSAAVAEEGQSFAAASKGGRAECMEMNEVRIHLFRTPITGRLRSLETCQWVFQVAPANAPLSRDD